MTMDDKARDTGIMFASRVAIVISESRGAGKTDRVDAPDRLLRVWNMLNEAAEELEAAAVSPETVPRLQRLLADATRELERSLSPALADELRRLVPQRTEPAGLAELQIDYMSVLGWLSGLVMQVLARLEAVR